MPEDNRVQSSPEHVRADQNTCSSARTIFRMLARITFLSYQPVNDLGPILETNISPRIKEDLLTMGDFSFNASVSAFQTYQSLPEE